MLVWAAATLVSLGIGGWQEGGLWRPSEGSSSSWEGGTNSSSSSSNVAGYRKGLPWLSSLLSSQSMTSLPEPLYATGETSTAEAGPVVMDGRGTAFPMLVNYPPTQPLSISAWVLVYSPPLPVTGDGLDKAAAGNSSSSNTTTTTTSWLPRPPREMTLLSFGRPAIPPPSAPTTKTNDSSSSSSSFRNPAPSIHLSVGNSNASLGRLFFSGTADLKGALIGFHSLAPLPLNRWVHVGLVLAPLPPPKEEGMMWGRMTGREGGREGRKKGRVALCGFMDGELQGRLELETDVWDAAAAAAVTAAAAVEEGKEGMEGEAGKEEAYQQQRLAARRRRRALRQQQAAQQREWDRAVFVWGGVRARGGGMLTGLLQHARVYVNQSLTTPQMHEAMSELPPWPVPSQVAGPLGLAPLPTPGTAAAAAAAATADEGGKEEVGTRWVEKAVALLHEEGREEGDEEEEERKRLAHWYLSGAILLHSDDGGKVLENENENEDVLTADGSDLDKEEEGKEEQNEGGEGVVESTSSSSSDSSSNDGMGEKGVPAAGGIGTGGSSPWSVWQRLEGWWPRLEIHAQLQQAWWDIQSYVSSISFSSFTLEWGRGGLEKEGTEEEKEEGGREGEERFVLPGAGSAHLAQLILASQALHGLDREEGGREEGKAAGREGSVLNPAFLRRYGEEVVLRQQDLPTSSSVLFPSSCTSSSSSSSPASSSSASPEGCPLAVAHYLSLADSATTNFGFEFRHAGKEGGREGGGEGRLFPRSLIIKKVEELLLREKGEEEGDGLSSSPPSLHHHPFEQQQQADNPWHDDQLEYWRVRAEGGQDAEALAWYAQALYYGQHGVPPDRAAAERMMERAAELGHPEAQYNAGVMLLQGARGGGGGGGGGGAAGRAARAARAARAEELMGRAARQGFFPALAAQGLWALQQREGGSEVMFGDEEEEEGAVEGGEEEEVGGKRNETAAEAKERRKWARGLLERAATEGNNRDAHYALALLKGGLRVGMRSWQITSSFWEEEEGEERNGDEDKELKEEEEEEEEEEGDVDEDEEAMLRGREGLWTVARHVARATDGGHAGARLYLANALWDPVRAFDVTTPGDGEEEDEEEGEEEEEEEEGMEAARLARTGATTDSSSSPSSASPPTRTQPRSHSLVIHDAGLGREPIKLTSLQRSCSTALSLARPVAEMTIAGLVTEARERYDAGDLLTARRLYALAAEAGVVSSLINAVWLEEREGAREGGRRSGRWRRWQQQLAMQGWGPALRGLGHDAAAAAATAVTPATAATAAAAAAAAAATADGVSDGEAEEEEEKQKAKEGEKEGEREGKFLEALALFHLAGTHKTDSRAFYDLAALLESKWSSSSSSSSTTNPSSLPTSSSLPALALQYYRLSMNLAKGVYRLPPFLGFLHLWLRTEARPTLLRRVQAWWRLGWVVEELVLWLALLVLGKVVSVLAARRRGRRQQQQQRRERGERQQRLGEGRIGEGGEERVDVDEGREEEEEEEATQEGQQGRREAAAALPGQGSSHLMGVALGPAASVTVLPAAAALSSVTSTTMSELASTGRVRGRDFSVISSEEKEEERDEKEEYQQGEGKMEGRILRKGAASIPTAAAAVTMGPMVSTSSPAPAVVPAAPTVTTPGGGAAAGGAAVAAGAVEEDSARS